MSPHANLSTVLVLRQQAVALTPGCFVVENLHYLHHQEHFVFPSLIEGLTDSLTKGLYFFIIPVVSETGGSILCY